MREIDETPDETPTRTAEEIIDEHRRDHAALEALYAAHALELWQGFTKNEKTLVRFGMFPADRMKSFDQAGLTDGRLAAVALMNCASADGGMRA